MLESRAAYGYYRDYGVTGETAPSETECTVRRLPYREYKKKYNDCEIVKGSYNVEEKTIEVYIPNERIKPSGMRDQKINWYGFWFSVDGEVFSTYYKAVNESNAARRFKSDCRRYHWEVSEFVHGCREYDRYASKLPTDLVTKVFKYAPELNPFSITF